MDSLNYLTTYSTAFGAPEVIFLIAHVALAIVGIYYAFIAKSGNTLRDESLRLLGYGLLALGIVGTLVAVLRLAVGAEFSMPIWITIVTVLDVALIAYALYSFRDQKPKTKFIKPLASFLSGAVGTMRSK